MKSVCNILFAFLGAIVLGACVREQIPTGGEEAPAVIRVNVWASEPVSMMRATDEQAIKDLHVLVYNASGELIGQTYTSGSTAKVITRSANGCHIYAIANTANPVAFAGQVADTETKLKNLTANISSWSEITDRPNMIMVGSQTYDIKAGEQTITGGLSLSRMAAKITLDVKGAEGMGITITDYQLVNLPSQGYYVLRPLSSEGALTDSQEPEAIKDLDAPGTPISNAPVVNVNSNTFSTSFYMFESRKGNKAAITQQKDKNETNAPANAPYLLIKGKGPGFTATWRVYLGGNNSSNFNTKRNCAYTYNITLNRTFADTRVTIDLAPATPLDVNGKANCYVATETQKTYSFDATVMGNGATTPAVTNTQNAQGEAIIPSTLNPVSAEVLWETGTAGNVIYPGSVRLDINTTNNTKRVVFTTNNAIEGNAVIAVRNASKEIIWSWHIWKTANDPTTNGPFEVDNFAGTHHYTMMDRNLGAANAIPGDAGSIGLLYQWGRKDPFPGPIVLGTNSPQLTTMSNGNPNGSPQTLGVQSVAYSIKNPSVFICSEAVNPPDWQSDPRQDNLWGNPNNTNTRPNIELGSKSIYDPCPAGWRVPPQDAFTRMTTTGDNTNIAAQYNTVGIFNFGWSFSFGIGLNNYFPAAGAKDTSTGKLFISGVRAHYWTSSHYYNGNGFSTTLCYGPENDLNCIDPLHRSQRGFGLNVRCVKENIVNTVPANAIDLTPGESETANSYIALQTGKAYSFKATVMGNGATTPAATGSAVGSAITPTVINPVSAKVIWETGYQGSVIYPQSTVVSNGRVYFTTGRSTEGNAVIAVYDGPNGTGNILWSWHIWKTASDPTLDYFTIADFSKKIYGTMMNRNMGASNNNPGDKGSIGLVYQWGRKDPFPGAADFTGTEWQVTTFGPKFPQIDNTPTTGTIEYGIRNPGVFILYSENKYDWLNSGKEDNLWGTPYIDFSNPATHLGSKSIYDPCPPGWRVPPFLIFSMVTKTGQSTADPTLFNIEGTWNSGYKFKLNPETPDNGYYFPSMGGWKSGFKTHSLPMNKDQGSYASSSAASITQDSYFMVFQQNLVGNSRQSRADAIAVRCVKTKIDVK